MNPLSSLPNDTSKQFSLNKTDWKKIGRMALVQILALIAAYLPTLAGMTYIYKGVNYTPVVLIVLSSAGEAIRKYTTGSTAAPEIPAVPNPIAPAAPALRIVQNPMTK